VKALKLLHFAEAWFTLAVVDIQVSFMPYRYWRHTLTGGLKPGPSPSDKVTQQVPAPASDSSNSSSSSDSISYINTNYSYTSDSEALLAQRIRPLIALSESATRRHWRTMNCLRRCLAQQRLLNRRNINAKMHIGVAKKSGKLTAHSWLSYRGIVINDSADVVERYTELHATADAQIQAMLK